MSGATVKRKPALRDWSRERGLIRSLIGAAALIIVAPPHNPEGWLTAVLGFAVLCDGLLTMRRSA